MAQFVPQKPPVPVLQWSLTTRRQENKPTRLHKSKLFMCYKQIRPHYKSPSGQAILPQWPRPNYAVATEIDVVDMSHFLWLTRPRVVDPQIQTLASTAHGHGSRFNHRRPYSRIPLSGHIGGMPNRAWKAINCMGSGQLSRASNEMGERITAGERWV